MLLPTITPYLKLESIRISREKLIIDSRVILTDTVKSVDSALEANLPNYFSPAGRSKD
jgi:hypothetical protein